MGKIVPNKKLGQHWLHDNSALQAMCDAVAIGPTDTVLEIGPGLGTLTSRLVSRANHVVAVEFDPFLAHSLSSRVTAGNLHVVHEDILSFNLTTLPAGYKVVANIPYFITSKIIRLLLESTNKPAAVALLVQKEVAERIAAGPGSMSTLSISAQLYSQVELDRIIPRSLFTPPPQVDSQIIVLTPFKQPLFPDIDSTQLFKVVKAGFSERRKKLRSSLSGSLRIDKIVVDDLLISAQISKEARAQELSLEQWAELTRAYLATMAK